MTSNQIRYWELQELKRSNRSRERETRRSNKATERLNRAYQMGTLDLRAQELAETIRRNIASENISLATLMETNRHNVVYESETNRHNLASESLTSRQLDISQHSLDETVRSHKAQERISYANLSELSRHNVAQEHLSSRQLDIESQYKTAMVEQGQQRIELDSKHIENENKRVLNETIARRETMRHNLADEKIRQEQNELRGYEIVLDGLQTAVKVGSALALAVG